MAAKFWRTLAIILILAGFLSGCAEAPPPPSPPISPPGPLPRITGRSPQDVALEQALGDFYGAPYLLGGNTPQGVDCSGLIQALFHRAGVNLPRTVAQQYTTGQPVAPGDLRFGDVVFFNRYCQTRARDFYLAGILPSFNTESVCHDGIYLGEGRFIHASPRGVVVSHLNAEVWRASFSGARRYLH